MDDLTGKKFNRWTVLRYAGKDANGIHRTWECECECGTIRAVDEQNLKRGVSKSCGCIQKEIVSERRTTHGKSNTRLYHVWCSLKARCYNENNLRYKDYGGRGITVCDEWVDNFDAFYEWSNSTGYKESAKYGECTLDRIDNSKGYSPDNCRWADLTAQGRNKRNNVYVTINGETKTAREWSDFFGISYATVRNRKHNGWHESQWFIPPTRKSWRSHG